MSGLGWFLLGVLTVVTLGGIWFARFAIKWWHDS